MKAKMRKLAPQFKFTVLPFSCGFLLHCSLLYVTPCMWFASASGNAISSPNGQTYIFTFPEVHSKDGSEVINYHQQLTIATTVPHDVTLNMTISTETTGIETRLGPDVIINGSVSLIVPVMSLNSTVTNSTLFTVKITSSDKINVYGFNFFTRNVDAELIRPLSQLGTNYEVLTAPYNSAKPAARSFFVATAVADDTHLNISKESDHPADLASFASSAATQLSADGTLLTVTLQPRQTVSTIFKGDLTGLRLRSDKPVALSCGLNRNKMKDGCCQDHMWLQLPGVDSWGREYVTFPTSIMAEGGQPTSDVFYLAAAQDGTTVYLDCNTTLTFPRAMAWQETMLDTLTFHVFYASSPFIVVKAVRGDDGLTDPCMLTLTPTSHWATTLTFPMPNTNLWEATKQYKFRVTVLMEESQTQDLRVNGGDPKIAWKPVVAGSSSSTSVMGGELTESYLSQSDGKYVLSSVTGTSRMAAYATGFTNRRGLCYALGGDAPKNEDWRPGGALFQCDEETTTVSMTTETVTSEKSTAPPATSTTTQETITTTIERTTSKTTDEATSTSTEAASTTTYEATSTTSKEATSTTTHEATSTTTHEATSTTTQEATSTTTQEATSMTETSAGSTFSSGPSTIPTTTPATAGTSVSSPDEATTSDMTTPPSTTSSLNSITVAATRATNSGTPATHAATDTGTTSSMLTNTTVKTQPPTTSGAQQAQRCYCIKTVHSNADKAAVAAEVDRIRNELLLSTRNLSSHVRKLTSAPDHRVSSVTMGSLGIGIISLVLILFVAFDVMRVVTWLCGNRSEKDGQEQNVQ